MINDGHKREDLANKAGNVALNADIVLSLMNALYIATTP